MALKDSYNINDDWRVAIGINSYWLTQTFLTTSEYSVESVKLKLWRANTPGTVTVSIRVTAGGEPTGGDLAVGTTDGDTLPTVEGSAEWREITFDSPHTLADNTVYAIVIRTLSTSGNLNWRMHSIGPAYTGGAGGESSDSGSTWTMQAVTWDFMWETHGSVAWPVGTIAATSGQTGVLSFDRTGLVGTIAGSAGQSGNLTFPTLSITGTIAAVGAASGFMLYGNILSKANIRTIKRLVAVGNDSLEYEDMAGSMTALTDSVNDIDTSDQLMLFEGYQKVFVVNGANLKIADFANVKLTVSAMTKPPAKGDILTQDNTGGNKAHMVVDFVNTAKTNIFGYAYYEGTTTAFITTVDISSNNATATMNPNPIPHANISTVTAGPHWYNWTVYPDVILTIDGSTKTYGTMPNKAYIGCLYRGRCMLSGDPEHPNQWYMPRQANPWDWAYIAGDAQTPVKGNNADAGEIGDIVRALIPYKDDYLIFGCATTMWFMAGDPAHGGSLNELDLTIGIFGSGSWCFDGTGNLFFWGTNGLYSTPIPGTPKCISEIPLPKLVKDEAADPSTYRIILGYDRIRAGILICITKLSNGRNSNYFYDLRSGGFFPEVYPDACGPYSLFFYAANNPAYTDLLVGCRDGYIRKFDDSAKDDDIGDTNKAIDSYVTFGPMPMASDVKYKGKLTGLDCITAGAKPSGDVSDSSPITYDVFIGDSAEQVIKKIAVDTAPTIAGTISAPGRRRGGIKRREVSGVYIGVKLQNDTAAQTWGFEQLMLDLKDFGRFK